MNSPSFNITGFIYSDKHPQGDVEHLQLDISYTYANGNITHPHSAAADFYGHSAKAFVEVLRAGSIPEREYDHEPADQYKKGFHAGSLDGWARARQSKPIGYVTIEDHDKRVSDLIKYNSGQVVMRRSFKAMLDTAVEALRKISDTGNAHMAPELAEEALEAIANFDPSTMGRP